jgi:hypothetical protein
MSGLNPNAGSFSFNPSAGSWTPPSATPKPPPAPVVEVAPQPEPVKQEEEGEEEIVLGSNGGNVESAVAVASAEDVDEGEDEIDENDPLWKAFLKLANGDRKKATEMLLEPDEYMNLPEIQAAMAEGDAAGGGGDDEWDADAPLQSIGGGAAAEPEVAEQAAPAPIVAAPASALSSKAAAYEEDEEVVEEVEEQDMDPREHLNLVFIGHVDAGKSTLSGNILYLTGYVDKRTIEKYEREAKQRNRDSWFLAFIMDTSDEERAKGKTIEVWHTNSDV